MEYTTFSQVKGLQTVDLTTIQIGLHIHAQQHEHCYITSKADRMVTPLLPFASRGYSWLRVTNDPCSIHARMSARRCQCGERDWWKCEIAHAVILTSYGDVHSRPPVVIGVDHGLPLGE